MTHPVLWKEHEERLRPFVQNAKGEWLEAAWAPQYGSQWVFEACNDFEVLYEGNRGGGKTLSLIAKFGRFCAQGFGPEWTGVIFRKNIKDLDDVKAKAQELIPRVWPTAKYNDNKGTWTWPDGEKLYLSSIERIEEYYDWRGRELSFVGWEELTTWPNDLLYKKFMQNIRSGGKRGVPKMVRGTTNPFGPGHGWVKERFRLPLPPGELAGPLIEDAVDLEGELEPPRRAIRSNLFENKCLLYADPGYVQRLRAGCTSEAEFQAYVHGSWDIVAGGMFNDVWKPKYNVVAPFEIPPSWHIDRSYDHGSASPFSVGWWAESDGSDVLTRDGWRSTVRGDLFRIGEWYGWTGKVNDGLKMLAADISRGIVERELNQGIHGRVRPGPADNQIYNVENGMCIAHDMAKPVRIGGKVYGGVQWIAADKRSGSRKTGWEMMRKMMRNAWPNEDGVPREAPGLFVFSTCDQFQRTVPVLPRNEKDLEDLVKGGEDHIADEVRYRVRTVGSRPRQGSHRGMF